MSNGACCNLCRASTPFLQVHDGDKVFCCYGCQAVYHILKQTNSLDNPLQSKVYQNALAQGLIANPDVKKEGSPLLFFDEKKLFLEVEGLLCSSCAFLIELILYRQAGILEAHVDFSTDLCAVRYDPKKQSKHTIKEAIKKAGYSACTLSLENDSAKKRKNSFKLFLCLFCTLNIMMLSYPLYVSYFWHVAKEYTFFFHFAALAFSLPLLYAAFPIWKKAFLFAKFGKIAVETLVSAAYFAALALALYSLFTQKAYFYLDSAAAIVALKVLGEHITTSQKKEVKATLLALFRSLPSKARIYSESKGWHWVHAKEVLLGDLIQIRPQEKVPLDGILIDGEGFFDESLLTGEVEVQKKQKGDFVCSGALLLSKTLTVKVSSLHTHSFMYRLVEYVEAKMGKKQPQTPLVEKIVGWFLPAVFLLALLVAGYGLASQNPSEMLARALSLLVIACPCAIGIAMPIVETRLLQLLSEFEIFVRNPQALWEISSIKRVVFDKTGTITKGKFSVQKGLEGLSNYEIQKVKAVSQMTSHPISQAIVNACSKVSALKTVQEQIFVGEGVQAVFADGDTVALGSTFFIEGITGKPICKLQEKGASLSALYFSFSKKQALIALGDTVRDEALECFRNLKNYQPFICSGDRQMVVESIAKQLGVLDFCAEASPDKKEEVIKKMQKEEGKIIFVGDGINDLLALTAADIGISFGKKNETCTFAADINICKDDLLLLPLLIRWVGKAEKIIKQNLFWAFFYNVLGLGLAITGFLHPLYAAFAMWSSSLIVLSNAYRMRDCRKKKLEHVVN